MHPTAAYAALRGVRVYRHTNPSTAWLPCRLASCDMAALIRVLAYHPRDGWDDAIVFTPENYVEASFDEVPDGAWERLQDHHLAMLDIR